MEFNDDVELAMRLLISFGIGTAIGLEWEYQRLCMKRGWVFEAASCPT